MSTRNLEALFAPRSIVLVGASERPGSVGDVLARNLTGAGFAGDITFVNPRGGMIHRRPAHRAVTDLPAAPDLAVIAAPAATVPGLVADLGALGCKGAVVISAGFEHDDPQSARLRQALLDASRPHLLRMVGPNCLGVLAPGAGVNASFARLAPPAGGVALVAQSGAIAAAALDWMPAQGLGFSHVVTLGDSLDVDVGDMLDYLAADDAVKVILLYVEALTAAPKFLRAARAASARKPVLAIKGGRSQAGARAAFSHTRALAGADAVYAAAFRQAGILQVDTLEDLLATGALLARRPADRSSSLTLVTNGGGAGVLAVDALEREGATLSVLSGATRQALTGVLPSDGAVGNPVDILGDAGPRLYEDALGIVLQAPEAGAVLVMNCPTAVADSTEAAAAVTRAAARHPDRPLLAAWLGELSVSAGREVLRQAGVPTFATPETAVRAFAQAGAAQALRANDWSPSATAAPPPAATALLVEVRADGRTSLEPQELTALLAIYGVPTLETRVGATPEAAADAARAIGGPVALKIVSPQLTHKSDVGGVRLGLSGADAVRAAAGEMATRIAAARPDAELRGFLVQAMADRPAAQEVLAGLVRDPTFGPVIVVGHGGVAVEVLADRALALPPLDDAAARALVARTRVSRLLAGYRDRPPVDMAALSALLQALSRMAVDLPELAELDLNPVLCDSRGVLAVDGRAALSAYS